MMKQIDGRYIRYPKVIKWTGSPSAVTESAISNIYFNVLYYEIILCVIMFRMIFQK